MPFTGDTFSHLFDWEKDPQRQEKIVNARLEAEFDGVDTGLSAVAARTAVVEAAVAAGVSDDAITNAKLANMAAYTLKGRNAGTTGDPSDINVSALTGKTSLANADLFLIQDSAASNAFKKVQRNDLGGPIYTELTFYRNPGTAMVSGITGTSYSAPGSAFSASGFSLYAGSFLSGRKILHARWLLAWTPGHAANATFVRLTHYDSGPTNITQIAEITATGTTPRVDAVDVTSSLQALLDAGVNKSLGNEHKGNGTQAPSVYLSTIELTWK